MFLAAFFQTDRSSKLKISFYFPWFFLVSVPPQFIKSLSQDPEEGHRARALWTWTSQIPPNPKSECQICSVSGPLDEWWITNASQIGAQTSVLFVSMFQVSRSLTSSLACGWNCPTIFFHKKKRRDDHITLVITHHTACFFIKDLDSETQRQWQRHSDRDWDWLFFGGSVTSVKFCQSFYLLLIQD